MPKMDFPHFDGTDAHIWLDKCLSYFALYQIPYAFRVSAASIHMSGLAAHWFQTFKMDHGFQQWDKFASVVISKFETDTHRAKIMELLSLKQTGGVEEYRRDFKHLLYHIRLYDNTLSNAMLTTQFLLGLKEELRSVVELQLPDSVAKAVVLTANQEKLLEKNQRRPSKGFNHRVHSGVHKSDSRSSVTLGDLWKARQLREHRRANGLCFKCGDKCAPGHKCADGSQEVSLAQLVAASQSGDGGGLMSDEILELLEVSTLQQDTDASTSLNAITRT
jgi:hypothetical protein